MAHRGEQAEAGDIGVAPRRHQLDAGVERFLLGIENVEDGAAADRIFGPHAFQRQRCRLDRLLVRIDRLERRLPAGIGGPRLRDHAALDLDLLFDRLRFERLGLAHLRGRTTALI